MVSDQVQEFQQRQKQLSETFQVHRKLKPMIPDQLFQFQPNFHQQLIFLCCLKKFFALENNMLSYSGCLTFINGFYFMEVKLSAIKHILAIMTKRT